MSSLAPFQDTVGRDKESDSAESENLKKYRRDGYLVIDLGLELDLINECAADTQKFLGEYVRIQDLWRRCESVKNLAKHPKVLAVLSELYDRRPFPFQTLNFTVGTQQRTHADTHFFNSFPERYMCGVWVALEDIDAGNGPLHYFRGSHTQPILSGAQMEAQGFSNFNDYFEHTSQNFEKKYGIIKKGEAVIWSAHVLHGGEVISDPSRSRLSQVTHYFFDNCVYSSPILSEPERGHVQFRRPYDISTDKFVDGEYKGKKIWPGLREYLNGPYYNLKKFVPKWK